MQKTIMRFPAALFLLLIAAARPASATDWVEVTKNKLGWIWSIDRDSVKAKSDSGIVSVWMKAVCPNKSYGMYLYEFNFSNRTLRWLATHEYDPNGKIIKSDTIPADWEYIPPDTVSEDIYLYLKEWLNW